MSSQILTLHASGAISSLKIGAIATRKPTVPLAVTLPLLLVALISTATAQSDLELEIRRSVEIRFPTESGKSYQLYISHDAEDWQPSGDFIPGTGEPAVTYRTAESHAQSLFRVQSFDLVPISAMIRIEPGTFQIGSPDNEPDRLTWEGPQTRVTLTRGYWMSRFEVTQEEFEALMGSNPSFFTGEANLPVDSATWFEALTYCELLTESERTAGRLPVGYAYRLPTEAEWEYACRAGTSTRFSYGDDPEYAEVGEYSWYIGNSDDRPHPVGLKRPNPWGLYDMNGNLWEWCLDNWPTPTEPYYPGGSVVDPKGIATGHDRVSRGAGWNNEASWLRSAFHCFYDPACPLWHQGFRVVLSAE